MPRRDKPDALSLALGARIRQLREEAGLTMERLAYETEVSSKGHLSSIERGLVRPTAHTLKALADGLGVQLADLVTFPDENDRERLFDLTRRMGAGHLRELLHDADDFVAHRPIPRATEKPSPTYRRRRPRTTE